MKDNNKRSDILSDHALERVMRDVFSGVWSPRVNEPDTHPSTLPTGAQIEEQADEDGCLQPLQLQSIKSGG